MFDRLKPSVVSLLHAILCIKMTSSWDPEVLPPCSEPILPYCQRLAAIKKAEGLSQLRKWRVVRSRAYKIRAASRHEYVSLTMVDPNNKNTSTYVAIERHRDDLVPADINPNIDSNINPNIEPNTILNPISTPNHYFPPLIPLFPLFLLLQIPSPHLALPTTGFRRCHPRE